MGKVVWEVERMGGSGWVERMLEMVEMVERDGGGWRGRGRGRAGESEGREGEGEGGKGMV